MHWISMTIVNTVNTRTRRYLTLAPFIYCLYTECQATSATVPVDDVTAPTAAAMMPLMPSAAYGAACSVL